MTELTARIKTLGRELGVNLIGIASGKNLKDAPPSADPGYLMPSAETVISFALALDSEKVRDFIGKKTWRPHCDDRKTTVMRLYEIGDRITGLLNSLGHDAMNVEINNNYRPEENAADVTEMTEFHPEFSHRYAAVAAGIGRLGWSGNLMTQEYGSLVELGSVITSARLIADSPIPDDEHPCDGCRMCSAVCPVGMVEPKDSVSLNVAGVTETISRKRPNTCCWIGCTGYEGLSASGTWSNWSPYRLGHPLPEDKEGIDQLCIRLQKADPQMHAEENSFSDYRKAVFDPDWFYHTVCGFCRSVCWPDRKDRLANRKLIQGSGTAALAPDGEHVPAGDDPRVVETPFGLNVVVPSESIAHFDGTDPLPNSLFPLDKAVIEHLRRHHG
jgi:epoxyqueuosine reductase